MCVSVVLFLVGGLDRSVKQLFCFLPWNAEVARDAIKRTFGTTATCPTVGN